MASLATQDDSSGDDSDYEELDPSLRNLVTQTSLKWIFVGGKGGVGKTTSSSSIGVLLSRTRKKVLIISTDPAHNVSDAFSQKFSNEPILIKGFTNLYAMEIDTKANSNNMSDLVGAEDEGAAASLQSMLKELTSAVPGIDECMGFAELMKQVQNMDYDCIVFDTAPTGHTLRLLSMPTVMEDAFEKINELKDRFSGLSGMFGQMSAMMGGQMPSQDAMMGQMDAIREVIRQVNAQFRDPTKTTFVCVCIPEFLSVYETERLVQELAKFGIDVHNIIVNQVLIPPQDWRPLADCWGDIKCQSRLKMQNKYLEQIFDLYEHCHIVTMPLLDAEVRGTKLLHYFADNLEEPYVPGTCNEYRDGKVAEAKAERAKEKESGASKQ
jgi:arsenite-transporting ATPase|tara:strand:+ start:77 stop:1219 length:1143 start_codon:yes stop_codon:yes gene_type:complete